jgi:tetratricopeptide (TPR) repeat protein
MSIVRIKIIAVFFAGFLLSSTAEAQIDWAKRYFELAVEHHLTGDNEESIKAFKDSLRHNNKDATTHYYLSLVYDRESMGTKAIKHMLKAEKLFEMGGRDYWKDRARQRIDEYYQIYRFSKEDFEE